MESKISHAQKATTPPIPVAAHASVIRQGTYACGEADLQDMHDRESKKQDG
jgi:hypothetical protein